MKTLKNIKRMLSFGKGKNKYFVVGIIIYMIFVVFGIVNPILSAKLLVHITARKYNKFIFIAILTFSIKLLDSALSYVFYALMRKWSKYCSYNAQSALLTEVGLIENAKLNKTASGIIIQRISNDCVDVFRDLWSIANQIKQVVVSISATITVLVLDIYIGIIMIGFAIGVCAVKILRIKYQNKQEKIVREKREKMISSTNEYVRGIRDIKLLGDDNKFTDYTKSNIEVYNDAQLNMQKKLHIYNVASNTLYDLCVLCICLLGVSLVKTDNITISTFVIIFQYRYHILDGFRYFTSIADILTTLNISADRIFEIIDSNKFPKEKFGNKTVKKLSGKFEFRNVTFHYDDDKPVIKNMSFTIEPKTMVGIVGKSGTGKTTIFNLLAKLYDVDSGEILLDDININKLSRESIRSNMSIINQSPYIFNLSIMDNLKLSNKYASEKIIKEACKAACLDEFIESLPNKYNTVVGEGGVTLSGGQKQRLAIARALIQKSEIIFFDEATSALDNETQSKIQKAIDNLKNKYTILIIAHRFSTVINCDKILYMEDGVIKAEGTHKELLKKCPSYKKLYELETKKELI